MAQIVTTHVHNAVDKIPGPALPIVRYSIGNDLYKSLKDELATQLIDKMPEMLKGLEGYAQVGCTALSIDEQAWFVCRRRGH